MFVVSVRGSESTDEPIWASGRPSTISLHVKTSEPGEHEMSESHSCHDSTTHFGWSLRYGKMKSGTPGKG